VENIILSTDQHVVDAGSNGALLDNLRSVLRSALDWLDSCQVTRVSRATRACVPFLVAASVIAQWWIIKL